MSSKCERKPSARKGRPFQGTLFPNPDIPPGMKEVFTPYITRNGRKIWAWQYGKKAFRFLVPA